MTTTNIYLWIRSNRSLQYFLPIINENQPKLEFEHFYMICLNLIKKYSNNSTIRFSDFFQCFNGTIHENFAEAIYQNAKIKDKVVLKSLIFSVIFSALQQKTENVEIKSRAEHILMLVIKKMHKIFKILYFLNYPKLKNDKEIFDEICEKQNFIFLDDFFEGTVKQKSGSVSNKSSVRRISEILPLIFEKYTEINSISTLCLIISNLIILDPYHIDEIPFDRITPGCNSFRRTTLAHNSRRVVHLHNINKFELLRKEEFSNIHLRICHDKPKASFVFVPLRTESVFLHSLEHCKGITLGAVKGIVVIDSCNHLQLTVSCHILIIINCSFLNIYFMSKQKPLIYNCKLINFAPFNTTYQIHSEILENCGQSFENNKQLKEPINMGNSSWKLMDTSKFLCQSTPLDTFDSDIDLLLNSLPLIYKKAAYRNIFEARKRLNNFDLRISDVLSNRDLIYLKSKIDKDSDSVDS